MRQRKSILLILLICTIGLVVLYYYAPTSSSFYPKCLFKKLSGYNCSFCGMLRGLHALTHGHVLQAIRLNAMFVIAIPVAAVGLANEAQLLNTNSPLRRWYIKIVTLKNVVIVLLAWWLIRNILGI